MFSGFNESTNEYLMGIRFNNNKEWFHEHKDMYRENVHEPICELADEIFAKMQDMDKNFTEIPKVSRANRDIRFSKNKNPYKECKWFFLRGDGKPDIIYSRPTYFFEMSPDWWRYGLFYAPTPTGMQLYRKRIENKPAEFKKIKKVYEKQNIFELEGDNYKRLFNKDIDKDIIDWYQKKYLGFTSWHDYSEEIFYQSTLSDLVFEGFKAIYPIYKYLDSIE
ncbi:MAG: DUF2461 domain-containing protein [Firmicutes bacterium]|nr:DUF2461 domain-containing protein [Bacillota bacterium]